MQGLVTKVVGSQEAGDKWETQLLTTQVNHSPLGWKDKERDSVTGTWVLDSTGSRAMMGPSWLNG